MAEAAPQMVYVTPALRDAPESPGHGEPLVTRHPSSTRVIPEDGCSVPNDLYTQRRIDEGSWIKQPPAVAEALEKLKRAKAEQAAAGESDATAKAADEAKAASAKAAEAAAAAEKKQLADIETRTKALTPKAAKPAQSPSGGKPGDSSNG